MTRIDFSSACTIHSYSEEVTLTRRRITNPVLESFSLSVFWFMKNNAEDISDEYWKPILSFFKRQRYLMMSTPLKFSHIDQLGSETAAATRRRLNLASNIFPGMAEEAVRVLQLYDRAAALNQNPLINSFLEYLEACNSTDRPAILIRDAKWVPLVEELFQKEMGLQSISVLSPEMLRGGDCYATILCAGPAKWFPDYVFLAGRASKINLFYYPWIGDRSTVPGVFPVKSATIKRKPQRIHYVQDDTDSNQYQSTETELLDADEVVPVLNVERIRHKIRQASEVHEHDYSLEVEAKLFVLEGDALVMLEMSEHSKAFVIDPIGLAAGTGEFEDAEEDSEAAVSRITTSEIEPGMFLLIRTSGGGDYVAPIADKILGTLAHGFRKVQQAWKARLKQKITELGGVEATVDKLRACGSRKANPSNLRNWTAERTIKTRDPEDFYAIMRLLDLDDYKEKLWKICETINNAHRKAGFEIRNVLLEKISQTNLAELEKTGRMDFSFDGTGDSNMAVVRVKRIVEESFSVPESSLGKFMEAHEDLWQ